MLPGESGRGYLLRLAEELDYSSPNMLLLVLGHRTREYEIDSEDVLQKLSLLLRTPYEQFKQRFYCSVADSKEREFLGHRLSKVYLNYNKPRICPHCIAERNMCQAAWDINLVTACPKHECELLDTCPQCKKKLAWNRSAVGKCKCGFDISTAKSVQASKSAIVIARAIYQALEIPSEPSGIEDEEATCAEIFALPFPSLLRVIGFLGATFHPSASSMKQLSYNRSELQSAIGVVEAAGKVLTNWPNNYHSQIHAANGNYKIEDEYDKKLAVAFGNYYRHLFRVLAGDEFNFLREAFETYLGAEWNGLIRGQHRKLSDTVKMGKNWIMVSEAAKMADRLSEQALRILVKEGHLKGKRGKTGPRGRSEVWLERQSVEAWVNESKKRIPRPTVVAMLGLKHHTVMDVAQSGLIRFQKGGFAGNAWSWNFSEEDVGRIVHAFEKHNLPVINYSGSKDHQIALQHALVDYLGRNQLVKVISAVIEGKVIPIGRAGKFKGIRDYIFLAKELRKYRSTGNVSSDIEFLNFNEAGRELKVNRHIVANLVKNGYLSTPLDYINGEDRLIPANELYKFKRKYVLLSQIARESNISSFLIKSFLEKRGVQEVVIDGEEVQGKYKNRLILYKRCDIDGIKIPSRKSGREKRVLN